MPKHAQRGAIDREDDSALQEAYEDEARRLYLRYAIEFVEGLNLCPWATSARVAGKTRVEILTKNDPSPEDALAPAHSISCDETIEVGLLVFPRLSLDRLGFERFVARVRELDAERYGIEGPRMAMAAFHPEAEARFGNPYQLVPFIRRTPDPTIQLVRRSVLESIRQNHVEGTAWVDLSKVSVEELLKKKTKPPLHERIAENNFEKLSEYGIDHAKAVLDEIRRDRDETYGAIEMRYKK